METILAGIAVTALQTLIKESPALFGAIRETMSKQDVTVEDIESLKQRIASDTYEKLVPNSQLGS